MPNKILTVLILFISLLVSCQVDETGGGSKHITIAPKMNSVSGNPSFSMSRSVMSGPRLDFIPYTLTNELDTIHRTAVPVEDWLVFVARASAPVFSGFEKIDYEDGATFDTDYYNKVIRTTVSRGETTVSYNGAFDDGGYYHLTISADNTYTYEQYTITDYVMVQPSLLTEVPIPSSYIAQVVRLAVYSTAQGTITDTDSDGTGSSRILEFTPHQMQSITIRGANDFDIVIDPVECWHIGVTAYVYDFQTKSREGFFGLRNSVPGQLRYQYNGYGTSLTETITRNVVYNNTELSDNIKLINTLGTEVLAYQNYSPNSDYIAYQVATVWNQIFVGAMDNGFMPSQAVMDARLAQINTIWSTY